MQLYANFPVSTQHWQVTAKILRPLAMEEGSFWAGMVRKAGSGPVAVSSQLLERKILFLRQSSDVVRNAALSHHSF